MPSFQKSFAIIALLNALGAYAAAHWALGVAVPNTYWIALLFITALSWIIHRILLKADQKRPQVFVNYFMASLTVKLLLSGILLIAVGLLAREELVFTAIGYLLAYFMLTAAEIADLLPRMKNTPH